MSDWLGGVRDRLGGREGRAWAGSVEDLLYDGEEVTTTVAFDGNRMVVTTHRLLAFTPETDGENYRQIDLPNVTDVRAGHRGEEHLLGHGARIALYGGILLAVGFLFDFSAFVPTDAFSGGGGAAAGQMGLGGLLGTLDTFMGVIARIDEFARLIGAALVLFAVFVVGVYLLTREGALVVGVAGDDPDVVVPADGDAVAGAVDRLESVLFVSGSAAPADGAGAGVGSAGAGGAPTGAAADGVESPDAGPVDGDPLPPDDGAADAGFKSDDPL